MTGLEGLVVVLGETAAVLVITLVGMILTTMIVVFATNVFLVVVSKMRIATLVVAIVAPVALIRKVANFVVVALHHFVVEFAFGTKLDLFFMLLSEQAQRRSRGFRRRGGVRSRGTLYGPPDETTCRTTQL